MRRERAPKIHFMYSAYALISQLAAQEETLFFRDFSVRRIDTVGHREDAISIFSGVDVAFGDWVYKRDYPTVPPPQNHSVVGRIPLDTEDVLFLLRLFKVGDICFLRHAVRMPDGRRIQRFPYRTMVDLFSASSYQFSQAECARWDTFASELTRLESWNSSWFRLARRFFLFGGSKEFVVGGEMDRIVDYMIALEAILVPERDFVSRRLRERASCLLTDDGAVRNLLRDFYDLRSTIAHGSELSDEQLTLAGKGMASFEGLVRRLMTNGLRYLHVDYERRTKQLAQLFEVADESRTEEILKHFNRMRDETERSRVLGLLSERRAKK